MSAVELEETVRELEATLAELRSFEKYLEHVADLWLGGADIYEL